MIVRQQYACSIVREGFLHDFARINTGVDSRRLSEKKQFSLIGGEFLQTCRKSGAADGFMAPLKRYTSIPQLPLSEPMTDTLQQTQNTPHVRVISYTRFSTPKQAKGTSIERQIGMAREWCKINNYVLDESEKFRDEGVSAFSGANSQTGKLALLQQQLATGEIAPGTILIVEALDRLTRQALQQAIGLMMNLVNSGLVIVTLADGKRWDKDTMGDLASFLMSVITLYRGYQESEYKSKRLRKTFAIHRDNGSTQAFGTAPGWLYRESKASPWQIDEEKAAVVRMVFEAAAAGLGSKAISKKAVEEGWPVPTRLNRTEGRWHGQMAGQILRNRAVIGEHQHRITTYEARNQHWRGLEVGEPVKNYYPAIVSDELWLAARASIRDRSVSKRRDSHFYNVFSGLLYCGCCGAPLHRKNGTKGFSRAQISCADRIAGRTTCQTMSARNLDGPLLQAIYEHSHESLSGQDAGKKDDEIAALEAAMDDNRRQTERIAEAIAATGGRVKAFVNKSLRLVDEYDALKLRLTKLEEAEVAKGDGPFDDSFVQEAMAYLYISDDAAAKEKRARLNVRLSRIVETIWIFAYDCAFIKYKNGDAFHVVPLPGKRLPSRVNPTSRYHKPLKEWVEPHKPIWSKHFVEGVTLPEPRRPKPLPWRSGAMVAPYYEDDIELEEASCVIGGSGEAAMDTLS